MKKNNKRIILIITITLAIIIATITALLVINSKTHIFASDKTKYNLGVEAMNNGSWDEAIEFLSDLDYENSNELLKKCIKEKGMNENSDYKFLKAISTSILKRYAKSKDNSGLESCVNYELQMLDKYRNENFYDNRLKELSSDYLKGLDMEKESITLPKGEQQLKKYEGTSIRFNTLKALTDEYNLLKDNDEYMSEYYSKAEKQEKEYKMLKAIEADLNKQFGDDLKADFVDESTCRISFYNHTEYTFNMLMFFTFYDKKDTIIDTREEYYENIKGKTKYNFDFYFPINAERFEYYTEEYFD